LIAEPVPFAAIRALPGDVVAGKAPEVLVHAVLADLKIAMATTPAEQGLLPATGADAPALLPASSAGGLCGLGLHIL